MMEFGLNMSTYGKTLLAACFITDLGTVLALGLIFAPFTVKTGIFVSASVVVFAVLPTLTPRFFKRHGGRPSELEAKYLLLCLFGMGFLAAWGYGSRLCTEHPNRQCHGWCAGFLGMWLGHLK
jgi:Kef-type K+ transport system membrane component KefB